MHDPWHQTCIEKTTTDTKFEQGWLLDGLVAGFWFLFWLCGRDFVFFVFFGVLLCLLSFCFVSFLLLLKGLLVLFGFCAGFLGVS